MMRGRPHRTIRPRATATAAATAALTLAVLVLTTRSVPATPAATAGHEHWSFQPVRQPAPPAVRHADRVRNPIDQFVVARLEARGIKPSPEADRATLIRRLYLDLLGLPPTPGEVDAFVNDTSPDAYERLVDRLLASPHYGERWARHWLDQARYADSNGYSIDSPRSIWPWRDWVISALNADMPFDQFTIEQLAGDLLPGATQDQIIATGFHRNTLINEEGGTDAEQFRVEAVVDRVNTTGQVWLGLTIGCAQCHSHKFDPITQREYYAFFAFFNSSDEPKITLANPQQQQRRKALEAQLAAAQKTLGDYDKTLAARQAAWEQTLGRIEPVAWQAPQVTEARSLKGATLTSLDDGSILAGGANASNDHYTITLRGGAGVGRITAVRLDLLPDDSLPQKGPGRAGNGNIVLTGVELKVGDRPVKFSHAVASHEQGGYPIAHAIDGKTDTGWAINGGGQAHPMNGPHHAVLFTAKPVAVTPADVLTVTLRHDAEQNPSYQVGRFKLSVTNASAAALTAAQAPALRQALTTPADQRNDEQKKLLADAFAAQDAGRSQLVAKVDALKKQVDEQRKSLVTTMVLKERASPRDTHIHIRGDFLNKGEAVTPGVPAVLPPLHAGAGGHDAEGTGQAAAAPDSHDANQKPPLANRLDLARWLVDRRNPLTPRVIMNRMWMRHFGRGIVETENDFGTQGTPPTHPQLLDWLASQFIARGWSLKAMHKLIVMSGTYRQSSAWRTDLADVDADNRLLARQSRFRVEGEIIRDLGLAASGLLCDRIGGPSVYPPQPPGVYDFTQSQRSWKTDTGDDRYRRGMYTFFYRSAPYPMLTTFDAPRFNRTCTRRARSDTPLQALTLANDEAIFEMAQALASRVLRESPASDGDRLGRAFRLCLGRRAKPAELDRLRAYLQAQTQSFGQDADAARHAAPKDRPGDVTDAQAAAWTAVARVLLNLDEFVTRE